jgi:hypothetical protein
LDHPEFAAHDGLDGLRQTSGNIASGNFCRFLAVETSDHSQRQLTRSVNSVKRYYALGKNTGVKVQIFGSS